MRCPVPAIELLAQESECEGDNNKHNDKHNDNDNDNDNDNNNYFDNDDNDDDNDSDNNNLRLLLLKKLLLNKECNRYSV